MRGIRDPRLLVDHRNAPTLMAVACEVIEPRHRAIVDGEGQPLLDHFAVASVAGYDHQAIDVADVVAHRRMTHPPPPCCDGSRLGWIGHREDPPIVSAVAVRQSTDRLK